MVAFGHQPLTTAGLWALVWDSAPLSIHPDALQRATASHEFLQRFAQETTIYGLHTGFGPMAQYAIPPEQQKALQYNLIRSHCTGMGKALAPELVRATMLCQLNTLLLGKSGVAPAVPTQILNLLNAQVYPVIYEHGGVGASGDLVQLAHLALGYLGEGLVWHQGTQQPSAEVFERLGLVPLKLQLRDGLALMNGTAVMTGVGLLNIQAAQNALHWSVIVSALLQEIVQAYDDHLSAPLNAAKQHPGQRTIAALLRQLLQGSQRLQNRAQHLYQQSHTDTTHSKKIQEYYSLRCLPQILGPIYDAIQHSQTTLEREANSVPDNPIVDLETAQVYHGGNFHGDYVALAMDHLRLAMTKLSMLAERQLNFLLHPALNQLLPPFANLGTLGLNFGLQGAQFTATSTTAENQFLANSIYVHSIPSNNDNQDLVSMGTNAANMTRRVIDNTYQVLAIECWAIVQAVTHLDLEQQLSPALAPYYQTIKNHLPPIIDDAPLAPHLQTFKNYLQHHLIQF